MIASAGVLTLVQLLLCNAMAGFEAVRKWNVKESSQSSTLRDSSCRMLWTSCDHKTPYDQGKHAVARRVLRRWEPLVCSRLRHHGMVFHFNGFASRQRRETLDVGLWIKHAFLARHSPLTNIGDALESSRYHSWTNRRSGATAACRKVGEGRIRNGTSQDRVRGGKRNSFGCTARGRSLEDTARTYAVAVANGAAGFSRQAPRSCRLRMTTRTFQLPAILFSGFSSVGTSSLRHTVAAAANTAGPPDPGIEHVPYNPSSFLDPTSVRAKETMYFQGAGPIREEPAAASQEEESGASYTAGESSEAESIWGVGNPIESPPLPPTRRSQIILDPSLVHPSETLRDARVLLDETKMEDKFQQGALLKQHSESTKERKKTDALDDDRLKGPLSMYDWEEVPRPDMNLEAPQDIYILDFDTVIQLNLREVIGTALRAWQQLEKERSALNGSAGRPRPQSSFHSQLRLDIRTPTEKENVHTCFGSECGTKTPSRPSLNGSSSTDATSRASLPQILALQRFVGTECPAWLEGRLRDARRSLSLRGSPDLMVAMRRIVELMLGVERSRGGKTIDSFVKQNEIFFRSEWEIMEAPEKMWLLTKGDPFAMEEVFKFRRGTAVAPGAPDATTYPWIVRQLQGWEKNGERTALFKRYNTSEAELQQAFDRARAKWRKADPKGWEEHLQYRYPVSHIDTKDADRLESYEGFNPAAIWCLNNHINNWRRPIHILSVWNTAAEVLSALRLVGLSPSDEQAADLVHIYGRDTMEQLAAAEAKSQASPVLGGAAFETNGWSSLPDVLQEEEETASLKRSALKYILQNWRAGRDAWRPVHVTDGSVRSLLAMRECPELRDVRLYFCEWGHSTLEDKAVAFLASRIKYIKQSTQLVKIISTPANIPARQWTHGYTSCPPEWMEDYKARRWLRWCGFIGEEETILQNISMPNGAHQ